MILNSNNCSGKCFYAYYNPVFFLNFVSVVIVVEVKKGRYET